MWIVLMKILLKVKNLIKELKRIILITTAILNKSLNKKTLKKWILRFKNGWFKKLEIECQHIEVELDKKIFLKH